MVPPPRVPTGCEEFSAFTDEFAKVRLRDGRGEKAYRHSHWWRRRRRPAAHQQARQRLPADAAEGRARLSRVSPRKIRRSAPACLQRLLSLPPERGERAGSSGTHPIWSRRRSKVACRAGLELPVSAMPRPSGRVSIGCSAPRVPSPRELHLRNAMARTCAPCAFEIDRAIRLASPPFGE